jgi:hypothetical protein
MLVCTATGARPGIAAFVIVTAMMKEMQQWARHQQQERQDPEQVSAVLGDQEVGRNRSECKKHGSRNRPLAIRTAAR